MGSERAVVVGFSLCFGRIGRGESIFGTGIVFVVCCVCGRSVMSII